MPSTLIIGFSTIDGYAPLFFARALLTLSAQGKGKKKIKQTMRLVVLLLHRFHHRLTPHLPQPSGEPATVKWITVGGRTSAYIAEVQKPSLKQKNRDKPPEGRRIRAAIRILDADAPKGVALSERPLTPEDVKISAWDRVVATAPHQTDTRDVFDLLRIWYHITFNLGPSVPGGLALEITTFAIEVRYMGILVR
ncbi:hypothetical protein J3R82DRAFT_1139 [Butyriboletus roseoflavus]|nr:hypothetical protein J3R82DRAFT_1139 [Butyriboletus roseoflavus]